MWHEAAESPANTWRGSQQTNNDDVPTPEHLEYLWQLSMRELGYFTEPNVASTLNVTTSSPSDSFPSTRHPSQLEPASTPWWPPRGPDERDETEYENVSFLRGSSRPSLRDAQEEWRSENAIRAGESDNMMSIWRRSVPSEAAREREAERLRLREAERARLMDGERARLRELVRNSELSDATGEADGLWRERLREMLTVLDREHGESARRAAGLAAPPRDGQQVSYGARENSENNLYDWSPLRRQMPDTSQPPPFAADEDAEDSRAHSNARRPPPRAGSSVHRDMTRMWNPEAPPSPMPFPPSPLRSGSTPGSGGGGGGGSSGNGGGSGSGSAAQSNEPSLRSQAMAQSMRRHPRFSVGLRDTAQQFIADREGSTEEARERERWMERRRRLANTAAQWRASAEAARLVSSGSDTASDTRDTLRTTAPDDSAASTGSRDHEIRIAPYRREWLNNPLRSSRVPERLSEPSSWLQQAILYLARLRHCHDLKQVFLHALEAGFATRIESTEETANDFLMDIDSIPRPAPTSWLAPGAVFSGTQHAPNGYNVPMSRSRGQGDRGSGTAARRPYQRGSTGREELWPEARQSNQRFLSAYSHLSSNVAAADRSRALKAESSPPDRWPVKVTIHSVDYEQMTMAATMEAYNVPSYGASSFASVISSANAANSNGGNSQDGPNSKTSSITTYLEGEILDFVKHTLLTESFPSRRDTDATYWRKLEPFAHLRSDDDMVRLLVSQRRMRELGEKYVLMRWKERCFVPKSETSVLGGVDGIGEPRQQDGARETARSYSWLNSGDGAVAETGEGCGLTISGFYYVALRRSDGAIEGLYCDPESSPYQHLRLTRALGGFFPTWEFT